MAEERRVGWRKDPDHSPWLSSTGIMECHRTLPFQTPLQARGGRQDAGRPPSALICLRTTPVRSPNCWIQQLTTVQDGASLPLLFSPYKSCTASSDFLRKLSSPSSAGPGSAAGTSSHPLRLPLPGRMTEGARVSWGFPPDAK